MSTSKIPNLLEAFRVNKGERSRPARLPASTSSELQDVVVQQTDNDAAGSRLSAVDVGYLDDAFARIFSPSSGPTRRMPVINRGTYVRSVAIDHLVETFLLEHSEELCQIISLGAGSDTRYFRLVKADPNLRNKLIYHELDFASSVNKKINTIKQNASVFSLLQDEILEDPSGTGPGSDHTSFVSASYVMHALDLRRLIRETKITLPGIKPLLPTLIISECCLTYLEAEEGSAVLKQITEVLLARETSCSVILYEPLHPDDSFGRTMISNLASRNISMPSLKTLTSIELHCNRLETVGFNAHQQGWSVGEWWSQRVPKREKERLQALEGLDEEEEWHLLAAHYGIITAGRRSRPG